MKKETWYENIKPPLEWGIIGLIIGVIFIVLFFFSVFLPSDTPLNIMFALASFFGLTTYLLTPLDFCAGTGGDGCLVYAPFMGFLLGVLFYTITGILIGYIIGKIKKK